MQVATRLRKAILQAAISGQLTEQRAADGDARDLLAAIRREKARRVRAGELKKERPLPPVDEAEVSFALPENWCWARLGNICLSIADGDHQAPPKVQKGVPFLVISNVSSGNISFMGCRHVPQKYYDNIAYNRRPEYGDTLFTVTGSYGIVVPVETHEPFCFQRHIALLKTCELDTEYLRFMLNSPLVKMQCDHVVTGTAQKTLALSSLKSLVVPIPPFEEQQRIVQQLTQMHGELSQLEEDERKLTTLETMFSGRMRAALLQAAMCGELTKRAVGDGDARDLLADIQREKTRLVKEKKLKKEKPLPPVTAEEVPFDIPENWCWVRIGMIGEVVGGGTPKTGEPENWSPATIPWLTPADMAGIKGRMVSHGARNISEAGLAHSSARLMPAGTVLFSSRAPIGYIGIAENELATNQGFKSVVPFHAGMSEYLYYCLMARTKYIQGIASGTTFLEVSGTAVKNVPIPLPPLAEQRRIVARLEELLPLCGELGERG